MKLTLRSVGTMRQVAKWQAPTLAQRKMIGDALLSHETRASDPMPALVTLLNEQITQGLFKAREFLAKPCVWYHLDGPNAPEARQRREAFHVDLVLGRIDPFPLNLDNVDAFYIACHEYLGALGRGRDYLGWHEMVAHEGWVQLPFIRRLPLIDLFLQSLEAYEASFAWQELLTPPPSPTLNLHLRHNRRQCRRVTVQAVRVSLQKMVEVLSAPREDAVTLGGAMYELCHVISGFSADVDLIFATIGLPPMLLSGSHFIQQKSGNNVDEVFEACHILVQRDLAGKLQQNADALLRELLAKLRRGQIVRYDLQKVSRLISNVESEDAYTLATELEKLQGLVRAISSV